MIKHLIFDLDGTLINRDLEVLPLTKRVLKKIQEELGVRLILASGRPVSMMKKIAESIDMHLHQGLMIANNGACIYDLTNNQYIYEKKLDPETIIQIVNHVNQFEMMPIVHRNHEMLVEKHHSGRVLRGDIELNMIERESESGGFDIVRVDSLVNEIDFAAYKVLSMGNMDYVRDYQEELMDGLEEICSGSITGPIAFEYTAKGVDKSSAFFALAEHLRLSSKDFIFFGDGPNDVSLFKVIEHTVAMGNAFDGLKKIATAVTDTNLEEGIARYLIPYYNLSI